MDIKNCVGQTPFDVADPDVLRLLEELKKKQNNCSKDRLDEYCIDFKGNSKISMLLKSIKRHNIENVNDHRPDIRALITRAPTTPGLGKGGRR